MRPLPLTPDFAPSTAVRRLDSARLTVDPALYLVGVLRSEWKPQNTDAVKPDVDLAEVHKGVQFRGGDWVTVYSTSQTSRPVTITYGWTNDDYTVTLDMFTAQNRFHAVKFYEEARRIVLNHRKDTFEPPGTNLTGRQWLEWGVRIVPFERILKGMYRTIVDVRVHWVFRQIQV